MIEAKVLAVLIETLCVLESNNDPSALSLDGQAVGILQIKPVVVEDLNRIAGKEKWLLTDRMNPAKSKVMAMDYIFHYWKPDMDYKDLALLWKKGPEGMNRGDLLAEEDRKYAQRVEAMMKGRIKG